MSRERIARPTDQDLERTQALTMATMKKQGVPVAKIAKHFGCSRITVWRRISEIPPEALARAEGIL